MKTYLRSYCGPSSFNHVYFCINEASKHWPAETNTVVDDDEADFDLGFPDVSSDQATAAFRKIQEYIKPLGDEYMLEDVEDEIQMAESHRAEAEAAQRAREAIHGAVSRLKGLQFTADYGEYYARNIRQDLARAWSRGEHQPKSRVYRLGEVETSAEANARQNAATGVTIQGAINAFLGCLDVIQALDGDFAKAVDKESAEKLYDAYDDVS